jgi:cytochrome c oxidase subunit 2
MGLRVISETPEEFAAWVERQRFGSPLVNGGKVTRDSTQPVDSLLLAGNGLFNGAGCIGCHSMVGTAMAGQTGMKGPNLSHVGSRSTIVAGMLENTPENLRKWLSNPDSVKKGTLMVLPRKLTDAEITLLVAYLRAHQ